MPHRKAVNSSSSKVEVGKPQPPPPEATETTETTKTTETSHSLDGNKVEVGNTPPLEATDNPHSHNENPVEVGNPPPLTAAENPNSRNGNRVYRSGPLFLPSKGIGWTTWKKRWFILTRTSLVFFRTDPNAVPPKGSETNLTLGGIDINSSGSVVVKEDKKQITILFPDTRDGRAFTLKAETAEDLNQWKAALDEALANAPSAAPVTGQADKDDQAKTALDASSDQSNDKQPAKSMVVGQPILLALEDIDGTPSFLEMALRFVEDHGVKVEGILRHAADVDDVERRIREYELGKNEFSPDEDSHVIADCIKYVLRELPSSPVPASCCNALLEAYRTERGIRVSAIRNALCETFPEPNRRLLQRLLSMMQTVAEHKKQNKMSISAVAACMAPLLLRPLLAGDCELGQTFDVGDDGSIQLMQAAAAANHAQAIVIYLLEEYDNLFGEGALTPEPYSATEESGSDNGLTEDDESFEDDCDDDGTEGSLDGIEDNYVYTSNGTSIEVGGTNNNNKGSTSSCSGSLSEQAEDILEPDQKLVSSAQTSLLQHDSKEGRERNKNRRNENPKFQANGSDQLVVVDVTDTSTSQKSSRASNANNNISVKSIDPPSEEADIQSLEATKAELQSRLADEAKRNKELQESLERRKNALHERRLDLEKDVARLQEEIQKERELRTVLEAGLEVPQGPISFSSSIDEKTKIQIKEIAQAEADVINLKKKADDLGAELKQSQQNPSYQPQLSPNHHRKLRHKQKDIGSTTAASNTLEKSTTNKHETQPDKEESDNDKKNLLSDPLFNPKSAGFMATTSSTEKPASIDSKNSGARKK